MAKARNQPSSAAAIILPAEVRQRFQSDMRILVDYLADGKDYVPTNQKVVHMEALLRALGRLTGDRRYVDILLEIAEKEEKEEIGMCELLDKYWNGGVAEGMTRGRAEGMAEGKAKGRIEGEAVHRR